MNLFITNHHYISWFGVVVLVLVSIMAFYSGADQHADESFHVAAADYYKTNLLPPSIGDPEIEHTYSSYGVSRLHFLECVYFLAGRFSLLLAPHKLDHHIEMRLFNVMLLALLVSFSFLNSDFRILLFPFFITPQLWYVFSYFNSDAISYFVFLIAAHQLVSRKSILHKCLSGQEDSKLFTILSTVTLGVVFSALLLSKLYYYFSNLFLLSYFLYLVGSKTINLSKKLCLNLVKIVTIGLSIFIIMVIIDQHVNDYQKKDRLYEAREQYAQPMFKPSAPLGFTFPTLEIKNKGVSILDIVTQLDWPKNTIQSSFGVYGFSTIRASIFYYTVMKLLIILLVCSYFYRAILVRGQDVSILLIALLNSLLLIFASIYNSWAFDYQPQGRYLLPILGIFSVVFFHYRPCSDNRNIIPILYIGLYLLSLYSFIFIGISGVTKLL